MSFLEDYLEKIGTLPIDVNRGLRLIRDLDARYHHANMRLEELQHEYLSRLKNAKDKKQEINKPEMQGMLEEIKQLQEECLGFCKSKVDTATQNYDIVDKQIEKLDGELKKFEDEIKEQSERLVSGNFDDPKKLSKNKKLKKLEANVSVEKLDTKSSMKFTKLKTSEKNMIHNILDITNEVLESTNTPIDQNEPRYCYCNGVSYGDMIKCDNPFCEREWFHFTCINMTTKPKGKWYCKDCKKNKNGIRF